MSLISERVPFFVTIDYMHTVCLGVAKNFFCHVYSSLQPAKRTVLNQRARNFRLPFEFQRSVRGLDQMSHFKASEFKTWLLYVSPVITLGLLNETLSDLLWKFSYAIRVLLETDEFLMECDTLLNDFCVGFAALDQNEQTFNLHSLRHLTWQVRNYGPLWTASCFAFESAHHSLVSTFTGSVNHLRLLVERYLTKKSLLSSKIDNDGLFDLTTELVRGRKKFGYGHLKESATVRELSLRASSVSAREIVNGVAYDSASDTKSDRNSFISYSSDCSGKLWFGQIIAFFRLDGRRFCLVERYIVEKAFTCPEADLACAFFRVAKPEERIDVPCDAIFAKMIAFFTDQEKFFVKLSPHFDHN